LLCLFRKFMEQLGDVVAAGGFGMASSCRRPIQQPSTVFVADLLDDRFQGREKRK